MKNAIKILKNKKGITLMECIVAIAILSICCWLTYGVFSNGTDILKRSNEQDAYVSQLSEESAKYIGETTTDNSDSITVSADGGSGTSTVIKGEWVTIEGENGEETTIFVPYEA